MKAKVPEKIYTNLDQPQIKSDFPELCEYVASTKYYPGDTTYHLAPRWVSVEDAEKMLPCDEVYWCEVLIEFDLMRSEKKLVTAFYIGDGGWEIDSEYYGDVLKVFNMPLPRPPEDE